MAFDTYDLGMTTLRTLQKQKIITSAQYTSVVDNFGWPCWKALKAADVAADAWMAAKSATTLEAMNTAFTAMSDVQKLLSGEITKLQGGK